MSSRVSTMSTPYFQFRRLYLCTFIKLHDVGQIIVCQPTLRRVTVSGGKVLLWLPSPNLCVFLSREELLASLVSTFYMRMKIFLVWIWWWAGCVRDAFSWSYGNVSKEQPCSRLNAYCFSCFLVHHCVQG